MIQACIIDPLERPYVGFEDFTAQHFRFHRDEILKKFSEKQNYEKLKVLLSDEHLNSICAKGNMKVVIVLDD